MKIIHVINFMGTGGVETFLKNLIFEQCKIHEIIIVTLIDQNTYNFNDFIPVADKVTFIELPYEKIFDIRIVFKLRRIISNIRPDIVHTHLFPGQFIVPISLIGLTPRLLTTEHGISLRRVKFQLFHYLEWISFYLYDYIICVSDAVNFSLASEYPSLSSKIVTINNGIQIQNILEATKVPKKSLSSKFLEDDIILCMVGRLEIGKDFETLIKSMKNLSDNYKLLIVGEGSKEEELKIIVNDLGLEGRVHFFGFKKDIYFIYKSIDIFILSSEREGLPMVLLEAMSAKIPCLGSNVDGIKALLSDNNLLFEYKNEKELSDKILNITNYYNLYAEKCYGIVQNYSFDKMFDDYEKIYKKMDIKK